MTSDIFKSSAKHGEAKAGAAHPGNLESRARAAASKAANIVEFRKALGIPHAQAMALNERLKLNVPILREDRAAAPERRAVPKPQSKQKGAKS